MLSKNFLTHRDAIWVEPVLAIFAHDHFVIAFILGLTLTINLTPLRTIDNQSFWTPRWLCFLLFLRKTSQVLNHGIRTQLLLKHRSSLFLLRWYEPAMNIIKHCRKLICFLLLLFLLRWYDPAMNTNKYWCNIIYLLLHLIFGLCHHSIFRSWVADELQSWRTSWGSKLSLWLRHHHTLDLTPHFSIVWVYFLVSLHNLHLLQLFRADTI